MAMTRIVTDGVQALIIGEDFVGVEVEFVACFAFEVGVGVGGDEFEV